MKAIINGFDIEGSPEEIAQLIMEIENNKKSPPVSTFPSYPTYEYHPPVYITPLPSTVNPNPYRPQVWCGGFSSNGSVTCKQDKNVQVYN